MSCNTPSSYLTLNAFAFPLGYSFLIINLSHKTQELAYH